MGCYLEEYRARVATWITRHSWRTAAAGLVVTRGERSSIGKIVLCAATLAAPGPGENIVQVLCSFSGIVYQYGQIMVAAYRIYGKTSRTVFESIERFVPHKILKKKNPDPEYNNEVK
jgi:hypothetical protein